jgi:hypothetical protein
VQLIDDGVFVPVGLVAIDHPVSGSDGSVVAAVVSPAGRAA